MEMGPEKERKRRFQRPSSLLTESNGDLISCLISRDFHFTCHCLHFSLLCLCYCLLPSIPFFVCYSMFICSRNPFSKALRDSNITILKFAFIIALIVHLCLFVLSLLISKLSVVHLSIVYHWIIWCVLSIRLYFI